MRSPRAHGGRNTNLHGLVSLERFVGRDRDLAAIAAASSRGDRLVTLLGPSGMGKTRLAQRFGEVHGDEYRSAGGVWFCGLTEARQVADLCAAVMRALGMPARAELDTAASVERIGDTLAGAGPVLLILDNFEHLAGTAGAIVAQWCAVAAEAFLLVTSQTRLGVAGETVIDLPPLADEDALALYQERARAAGGASGGDALALVRALDGIPLAIELAAARSRVLDATALLARLETRLDLLDDRASTRPRRHATLRAAIDWSWELLSPAEQSVLAQCAVFAGEFSLEDVEAISTCSGPLLDVLAALVDKSLVRSTSRQRFALYSSIREYAAEHLERRGDAREVALRHRRHFIDTARVFADEHARTGSTSSRAALAEAKENLLVIERDLSRSSLAAVADAADLAQVIRQLEPIVATEANASELLPMLERGCAAAAYAGEHRLRGTLLVARGNALGLRGHLDAALGDIEAARELGRVHGDPILEAEALVMASVRYRHQGRFDTARAACERALALLEGRDQPRIEGAARAVLGLTFCELGEIDASLRENLRARAIFQEAGDRWSEGLPLANLGQLYQATGAFDLSAHAYEAALERFREHGDRRYESRYLGYLANLELEREDFAAARAAYATALEMLEGLRIPHGEALFRACLGALEALEGHSREAIAELDRAQTLATRVDIPAVVSAIEVHLGHRDLLAARGAFAVGDAARGEDCLRSARERLSQARFASQSEDVRFAARLLERTLGRREPKAASARPGLDLTVDARRFRVGNGDVVDLGRRSSLRLLLLALAELRSSEPGRSVGWASLLGAGWPGEKVIPSAGATRVRVAISTLRRLGLAGILLTREDGYLIDPRTELRLGAEL